MSSLPGFYLEDYLAWRYNLRVEDSAEANASLGIAEALGLVLHGHRPLLSSEQFEPLVALFEPLRDQIERLLLDFDGETMSWRTYGGSAFDLITAELHRQAKDYLASFK
jgi:hypothetical protein